MLLESTVRIEGVTFLLMEKRSSMLTNCALSSSFAAQKNIYSFLTSGSLETKILKIWLTWLCVDDFEHLHDLHAYVAIDPYMALHCLHVVLH